MSLSFMARADGDDPPAQYLTLTRNDGRSGHWTLTSKSPWLGTSSAGDTLPFLVVVRPRTAGLSVGSVAGSVTIAMGKQNQMVPVTLDLRSTRSVGGRWIGVADTLDVALSLDDSAGVVRGNGTLSGSPEPLSVTGSYADPVIVLTLVGSSPDTARLAGTLVNDNTISARFTGHGRTDLSINLLRQ